MAELEAYNNYEFYWVGQHVEVTLVAAPVVEEECHSLSLNRYGTNSF